MSSTRTRWERVPLSENVELHIRLRWHSKRFVVAHVTAPEATAGAERPPVNLAFVIDRSGSMANGRLELAL